MYFKSLTTISYFVSNIKPTALQRSLLGLKTIFSPPVPLVRRKPNQQSLFRTAAEQQIKEVKKNYQNNDGNVVKETIIVEAPIDAKPVVQTRLIQKEEPGTLDKIGSWFSSKSATNQVEGHTAEEVIANVHKMTDKRRAVSGDKPIARVRPIPETASELRILHEKNIGLNLFINRVYITTGASIMMALGTIHIISSIPYFVMNPLLCIGYGSVMMLTGMLGAYYIKPHIVVEQQEGYEHIKTRNGILRTTLFVMGWSGLGLLSTPFVNMIASFMPMIVPNLMAMTVGCFGGASIFIASMPRMPLFTYGGLIGGLIGSVLSMRLMNTFNSLIYGEHFISNFIQAIDLYGGTLVFSFFIVYNTIKAKEAYAAGNSDHLEISIKFYYDMVMYMRKIINFIFRRKID